MRVGRCRVSALPENLLPRELHDQRRPGGPSGVEMISAKLEIASRYICYVAVYNALVYDNHKYSRRSKNSPRPTSILLDAFPSLADIAPPIF